MESKTIKDAFLEFRSEIDSGKAPKNLTAAFVAGARAALEILTDPFTCCVATAERIKEMDRQLDQMDHPNTQKTEAQKAHMESERAK